MSLFRCGGGSESDLIIEGNYSQNTYYPSATSWYNATQGNLVIPYDGYANIRVFNNGAINANAYIDLYINNELIHRFYCDHVYTLGWIIGKEVHQNDLIKITTTNSVPVNMLFQYELYYI